MSKYLDKEKLLKWANDNYFDEKYSHDRSRAYQHLMNELSKGTFDNYSAHNAVALLDELEIKLNEANRRIEQLEKEHDELWDQAQRWREESGN